MKLPIELLSFAKWLVIKIPKKIITLGYRFLVVANNEFGFSLNLGLLFTPIFGDYTIIGRLIGFTFRVIQVISGIAIMLVIVLFVTITPILYLLTPIVLTILEPLLIIPTLIGMYIFWKSQKSNLGQKKLNEVQENNLLEAFRPKARAFYEICSVDLIEGLEKFQEDPDISYIFKKLEATNNKNNVFSKLMESPSFNKNEYLKSIIEIAKNQKTTYVEHEQVFLSTLTQIPKVNVILQTFGTSLEEVEGSIKWTLAERQKLDKLYIWQDDYELPKIAGVGRTMTGRVTPDLDRISEDFTKQAKKTYNRRYVAHKPEMDKVADILSGSKGNVLIIGEPGSGKTSIVRNLAFGITRGTEYQGLKFKRIVNIETGKLMSGAKNSGELTQKLRKAMEDVEKSGDIIIFIDEIHNIVSGVSNEASEVSSVFSVLESYLNSNKTQFIGATSVQNYRKYIEPNGSFARLFQIVEIPPSTKEETLEVIKVIAAEKEKETKNFISYPALTKIIELSGRLIQERVFPDKAIDILIRALSYSGKAGIVDKNLISKVVSEVTKIPVENITEEESTKLLHIEDELKKRVIGQDIALNLISKALKRARMGIRNENKPIASFLFVGTTGVGKTETAKALAKTYFGDAKKMIRLDMSEYQQIDSINKLIGNPEGTMKGILTESVRTNPFTLILLDEIEKAYSTVLLAFLQVLDDARLTDTSGRVIDFSNTIIIATSNVGTRVIQEVSERNGTFEEMSEKAMIEVRNKYAPEFLNRFNSIIVYKPLTKDSVASICNLLLSNVVSIAKSKGITLTFKQELIEKLIEKGFSPEWGARPLTRVIEDTVETYIASKLISKELKMGDEITLGLEVFDSN